MNIVMVLTTILVLNITIFPYAEFSRTMMAMHTQCPEVKQYVLLIICSMIRMSNFGIVYICMVSLLMYFTICMIFIDLSRCEQSMLIVFSLKQVFKISSLRSVQSYPRDEITEQQILGFHPMAENSKINNYLKKGFCLASAMGR